MRKLFVRVLALACAVLCSPAYANADWILSQAQPDGQLSTANDVATPAQATAEAVRALRLLGRGAEVAAAEAYLATQTFPRTELLSRRIVAAAQAGQVATAPIDGLLFNRNSDGGFGELTGYASTALDTAFAVEALALSGNVEHVAAGFGVGYLLQTQAANGSWSSIDGTASVYVTALAVRALWHYRHRFNVVPGIVAARSWLLAQRDANALWAEPHLSALALTALLPTVEDKSVLQSSTDALSALAGPNGSWFDDVYVTALALQALNAAVQPHADRSIISGRVVDGDDQSVLVGATVNISGPRSATRVTGADGRFSFETTEAGAYQLAISQPNYSPVVATTGVQPGQDVDFGDIALLRGLTPTTAVLRGRVTDELSGVPIAGATVTLEELQLSATTDAAGDYQIVNIPAGPATLSVSSAGYATAQGSATFVAGQIFNFSPQLAFATSTTVSVEGVVTEADGGALLAGVTISVTGAGNDVQITTDADGTYSVGDLSPGALTVTAELAGYHPVSGSINAAAGTRVLFSPALTVVSLPPPPPPNGTVLAVLVDSVSGQLIANATAQLFLDGAVRATATSNAEGVVTLSAAAGNGELRLTRSNYQARTIPLGVASGTVLDLGQIELVPTSLGAGGAFRGVVVNATTDAPLSGVTVRARFGTTTGTVSTNSTGAFQFTGRNPLDGTVELTRTGYEPVQLGLVLTLGEMVELGNVYMRPVDTDEVMGDLAIQSLDVTGLTSDADTFAAGGTIGVQLHNRGVAPLSGNVNVKAFYDADGDSAYTAGVDTELGNGRQMLALEPSGVASLIVPVSGMLPFRAAPITLLADSDNVLIEQNENNNTDTTAGICTESGGIAVDLALCLDSSGSISAANFALQLNGTAAAIENPAIIPHDGSVRLTVMQFASSTRVEITPTVVDSGSAVTLAERVRAIRKSGGGTSIHSCINTARTQLVAATPAAALQVIDLATDGGSSQSAAEQAAAAAQAAGIDSLNALAVGAGANLTVLNAIVFPRNGGPDDGFVVAIDTFEEYADAISAKIRRETRTADLTLGALRVVDGGSGQPAVLRARVGNGGARTVAAGVTVAFYRGVPESGGELLGEIVLPLLQPGAFLDIELPGVTGLSGGEEVVAIVDPAGTAGECATSNNRATTVAEGLLGAITVNTDAAVYGPNAPAELRANVANTGALNGAFRYTLQVEDASGVPVAAFAAADTGSVAAGTTAQFTTPWNTSSFLAGSYRLRGRLFALDDSLLAEATSDFEIRHPDDQGPIASLRTTVDRPTYHTTDTVDIESLVQNHSVSTLLPETFLQIRVIGPQGEVASFSSAVGDLIPSAIREERDALPLIEAPQGVYQVLGELRNAAGQVIASSGTGFEVIEDLTRSLVGSVEAQRATLYLGETQICTDTVSNEGTQPLSAQQLRSLLVRLSDGEVITSADRPVTLAPDASDQNVRSVPTSGLALGDYACALQALIEGTWEDLGHDVFTIEEPPIDIGASLEIGPRGRLLVLLDHVDGWSCAPIQSVELWSGFRTALPADAFIDVSLRNAAGDLLETESFELASYSGTVNSVTGGAVDLRVTGASPDVLTVELRSTGTLPGGLQIEAWLTSGEQSDIILYSGMMGGACGWPYGVGVPFHDFEVSRMDLPPGAPQPPAWTGAPSLSAQRAFLESLLDQRGWSYTIVDDAGAFEDELRTGQYSVYALFAEHIALHPDIQGELREAVYRGEGLLDAGEHDDRHYELDAALGVRWPISAYGYTGVDFLNSPLLPAQSTPFLLDHGGEDDLLIIELNGAQTMGRYAGSGQPSLTTHSYGDGRSVFVGYDLLAEATAAGNASSHATALLNALDHVHPDLSVVHTEQVVPLRVRLENQGSATPGRVVLPLPADVTLIDPGAAQLSDDTLTWTFDLAEAQSIELDFWVRLREQAGPVPFDAAVQYLAEGAYVDHTDAQLTVSVAARPTLAEARAAALGAGLSDIVIWLDEAQQELNASDFAAAAKCLVDTAEELELSGHPQAPAIRSMIDHVLWQVDRLR